MTPDTTASGDARMSLLVTHTSQHDGRIEGFMFLWAFYVRGYHPDRHCQPCFIGQRVQAFHTATARVSTPVIFDRMARYPYLYICGVAAGPRAMRRERNLHLPLVHAPGEHVAVTTYNGYHFTLSHARQVTVPALPVGWEGRAEAQVRCRNYQFAVACFGQQGDHGPADDRR